MPLLLDLLFEAAANDLKRQARRHHQEVRLTRTRSMEATFPVSLPSVLAAVLASLSVELGVDLKELEERAEERAARAVVEHAFARGGSLNGQAEEKDGSVLHPDEKYCCGRCANTEVKEAGPVP